MKWKYCLFEFGLVLILLVLPTSILWWQYAISGHDIIQLSATITKLDKSSLDDCNIFDKSKHQIIVKYEYDYGNNTYKGEYEICETNNGAKTYLKLHKEGSFVKVYIKPDHPGRSNIKFRALMNKYFLGFAIFLSFVSVLALSFLTCCFDTITKELKESITDKIKNATDNALSSVV